MVLAFRRQRRRQVSDGSLLVVWALLGILYIARGVTGFVDDARYNDALDARSDPRPYWPDALTISFNETTSIPLLSDTTTGVLYYDSSRNAERVDRAEGRGDRYCGSVHPLKHTPCTHVAVNGMRYLIFPELKTCCSCCSFAAGCGPLTPTWLNNATYVPPAAGSDSSIDCFNVHGLQNNIFCQYSGSHAPLRLSQGKIDDTYYDVSTFVEGHPDPSVFELPSTCTTKCGGICRFL